MFWHWFLHRMRGFKRNKHKGTEEEWPLTLWDDPMEPTSSAEESPDTSVTEKKDTDKEEDIFAMRRKWWEAVTDELGGYESETLYRTCTITVADVDNLQQQVFPVLADGGQEHCISITDKTTLLNVDNPGEYQCIYEYDSHTEKKPVKGKVLCVLDREYHEDFAHIADLKERAGSIGYFASCSPEQQQYITTLRRMEERTDADDEAVARRRRREIITNPHSLEMMFQMCQHTLPENIRRQCKELIKTLGCSSDGNHSAAILTDILYTCCESEEKKPFLSTQECMEVFRQRRYGNDPWIRDMVRQIRLLDRCDHSGAVFLLIGPPGTGKTQIGEVIAICTRKRFCVVDCRNKNAMEIGGSNRTYVNSHHGEIMDALLYHGNDSCILLDEFGSMVTNEKEGNPYDNFVSVWDDRKVFIDNYTQVPVSTKNVIWILTVNSLDQVPDYILNRFQENVFVVDSYTAQTKAEICKQFIVPNYMQTFHFDEGQVQFTDDGLVAIAKTTSDGGARVTAQKISKILGAVNELLEEGAETPVVIDAAFATAALKNAARTYTEKRYSIGY